MMGSILIVILQTMPYFLPQCCMFMTKVICSHGYGLQILGLITTPTDFDRLASPQMAGVVVKPQIFTLPTRIFTF
ncbi:hypothetical protein JCM12294_13800 [Desulfocicer niacini]